MQCNARYPCCNSAYHTVFFNLFDRNEDISKLLIGDDMGEYVGVIRGDTRSLDCSSYQVTAICTAKLLFISMRP